MTVSFTISKKGKIYRPQARTVETNEQDQDFHDDGESSTQAQHQSDSTMYASSAKAKSFALFKATLEQLEALGPSFSLNMYENGFTIGNVEEFLNDVPIESLIPYNQHTEPILIDIECGRLPTGILQNMSLKYVNGTVLCEVRDHRVFVEFPVINTVPLKMGLDNVIEDMSSMFEELSYGDMLTFQSRVLTFLYPYLNLDPTPTLDFCEETKTMIDLGITSEARKKQREMERLSSTDSLQDRFANIDMLTRRQSVAERTPAEYPNFTTPVYMTDLVATHLGEDEELKQGLILD